MVEVGDNVATSAVYQPNMPIKWSAEKVWRVQESSRGNVKEECDKTTSKSPTHGRESRNSHPRDAAPTRDMVSSSDRKRYRSPDRRRSRSRDVTSSERTDAKRRRLSPTRGRSRSPVRLARSKIDYAPKALLNTKEMLIPDIHFHFPGLLAPVDMYRLVCHWQDSFPLLKPLQPDRSTCFQVLKGDQTDVTTKCKEDTGFYVNVLLLSMPSINTLQDKTIIRAEVPENDKPSLKRFVKILCASKSKQNFKAFGGSWNSELDGDDPINTPGVLIRTAIRICKDQLGLDLSHCTQWHRFLEFRYSRTEGSTARPTSVLFPGTELWGRSFTDTDHKNSNTMKPFHRIVIYFIPDIWSIMPSSDSWTNIKDAMEVALSGGSKQNFPISADELKTYIGHKEEDGIPNGKDPSKVNSTDLSSNTAGSNAGSAAAQTLDAEKTKSESTENTGDAASGTLEQESELKTPVSTSAGADEDSGLNKSTKKSHEDLNLSAMKVSELREQLKARNLPSDGIKAQLLSRLKTAVEKEAEQARKLEEERKRKEKEQHDAQALKEEEERKRESLKPPEPAPKPLANVSLRNYPSIIVQNRLPDEYTIQTIAIDTILGTKAEVMDSSAYEFIICAHSLLDMIRRDCIFTLFRALVSAGDRGVQAKSRPRISSDRHNRGRDSKTDPSKDAIPFTVDVPLLFACTFLDPAHREYFTSDEVEDMLSTLGLPASRYQIRSLITKVADGRRVFYRSLTDAEVSPSSVKSTSMYSEIDDDEYLLELIRGGDAILDDQKETHLPLGSVLVIPDSTLEPTASPVESMDGSAPSACAQSIRRLEFERTKLKKQLQSKIEEIDRLRMLTEQIPSLKQKLASANSAVDDYKQRFRAERDRAFYAHRLIMQQVDSLDSSRSALRQAARRLRPDESDSRKSATSDTKSQDSDSHKSKPDDKPNAGEKVGTKSVPEGVEKVVLPETADKGNNGEASLASKVDADSDKPEGAIMVEKNPCSTVQNEVIMVNGLGEENNAGDSADVPMTGNSDDVSAPSVEQTA